MLKVWDFDQIIHLFGFCLCVCVFFNHRTKRLVFNHTLIFLSFEKPIHILRAEYIATLNTQASASGAG